MGNRTCSVPECNDKHRARGYCRKHYNRLCRTGTINDPKQLTLADRFARHFNKTDGCWLWSGYVAETGYGTIKKAGAGSTTLLAHRVAYELANGPIPSGMVIDHICHTRSCVRLDHLRVVTQKQNVENFGVLPASNTSGVRGVSWSKRRGKWTVRVTHNHKPYDGGFYDDLKEAESVAIELRKRLHTHNDLDRIAS